VDSLTVKKDKFGKNHFLYQIDPSSNNNQQQPQVLHVKKKENVLPYTYNFEYNYNSNYNHNLNCCNVPNLNESINNLRAFSLKSGESKDLSCRNLIMREGTGTSNIIVDHENNNNLITLGAMFKAQTDGKIITKRKFVPVGHKLDATYILVSIGGIFKNNEGKNEYIKISKDKKFTDMTGEEHVVSLGCMAQVPNGLQIYMSEGRRVHTNTE